MNERIILRREKQISPRVPGFTRQQLRDLARQLGVARGRNTADTLANLKEAVRMGPLNVTPTIWNGLHKLNLLP